MSPSPQRLIMFFMWFKSWLPNPEYFMVQNLEGERAVEARSSGDCIQRCMKQAVVQQDWAWGQGFQCLTLTFWCSWLEILTWVTEEYKLILSLSGCVMLKLRSQRWQNTFSHSGFHFWRKAELLSDFQMRDSFHVHPWYFNKMKRYPARWKEDGKYLWWNLGNKKIEMSLNSQLRWVKRRTYLCPCCNLMQLM